MTFDPVIGSTHQNELECEPNGIIYLFIDFIFKGFKHVCREAPVVFLSP